MFTSCLSILVDKKEYADLFFNLGNSYRELNKSTEAINAYKKAIQIDKTFVSSSFNLARLLVEQKKYREAELLLEDMVKDNQFNLITTELLGYVYYLQEKYDKALNLYQYILEKNELNQNALYNSALIYIKLDKKEEALQRLLQYKDVIQDNSQVVKRIGLLSIEAKKNSDAIKYLADYLEKNGTDLPVKLEYARVLAKEKNYGTSLEIYNQLDVDSNTDSTITFERAKVVLIGLEDLKLGQEILLKALEKSFVNVDQLYELTETKDFLYKKEIVDFLKEKDFYYPPTYKRIDSEKEMDLIISNSDKNIHINSKCQKLKGLKKDKKTENKTTIKQAKADGGILCPVCTKDILFLPKEPYKIPKKETEETKKETEVKSETKIENK